MLLLSLDTSGHHGSMALARGLADPLEIVEVVPLAGGAYSARLIPELAVLLERHNLKKEDLGGLVVIAGPGSFTGLRVGLAATKGLAEILQLPIATLSMLEVIAAHASSGGVVVSALDAGRNEVFAGLYEVHQQQPRLIQESLMKRVEFVALLAARPAAELISPCEDVCHLSNLHLRVRQVDWPDAGQIARLGFGSIRSRKTTSPEALEANYIRRSDAENSWSRQIK